MKTLFRGVFPLVLFGLFALPMRAFDEKPEIANIRGKAMKVTPATEEAKKKGQLGTVLIEGVKEETTQYDKASVRITDKTKIEKLAGKERKPAKFEDLKVGAKVQAKFTGPVAESYPVQATAGELLILDDAK
jgi:hypothetical protein